MQSFLYTLASGTTDIEGKINAFSLRTISIATLVLIVLLVIASFVVKKDKVNHIKVPLFVLIAATIILPSLLLIGSTVYINTISESKGPVHWHTDVEFWVCGQEIELRDPTGFLSNKIGTATYHEHDDKRIHLEGVVVEKAYDASLKKFMDVTGGAITEDAITIPVEARLSENDIDGDQPSGTIESLRQYVTTDENNLSTMTLQNGDACENGVPAELQVFLLRYDEKDKTYSQEKLTDPGAYIMRDESVVPPGDCLIVEFDNFKSRTDRLCEQYGVRDEQRCTEFGVSSFNPELCNIRETSSSNDSPPQELEEESQNETVTDTPQETDTNTESEEAL